MAQQIDQNGTINGTINRPKMAQWAHKQLKKPFLAIFLCYNVEHEANNNSKHKRNGTGNKPNHKRNGTGNKTTNKGDRTGNKPNHERSGK